MNSSSNKPFIKNVATLLTGTVIAQLISFFGLIYIQRNYYGPEDFVSFKLFYEFAAIFIGISALKLETGIVLEKNLFKAQTLTKLSLKLVVVAGVISFIVFLIYSQFDEGLAKLSNNIYILFLLPIAVMLSGFIQVFNSWNTRQNSFKLMSVNKVSQNSSSLIGQIIFALSNLKSFGLIFGRMVGLTVSNIIFFTSFIKTYIKKEKEPGEEKSLVLKHKKFIFFTTPSVLLSGLVNFLLIDLFLKYYGEDFSGKIGSAYHYLGISIAVITTSFAQVYYSNISSINSKNELRKNYTYWLIRLSIAAIIGVVILYFFPSSWDNFILGEAWDGSLEIIKIMSIWMGIMFISSSLSYIYIKLGRQKEVLIFDIIHLVIVYFSIKIPYEFNCSKFECLWYFTIAQAAYYLSAIGLAYFFINKFKLDHDN